MQIIKKHPFFYSTQLLGWGGVRELNFPPVQISRCDLALFVSVKKTDNFKSSQCIVPCKNLPEQLKKIYFPRMLVSYENLFSQQLLWSFYCYLISRVRWICRRAVLAIVVMLSPPATLIQHPGVYTTHMSYIMCTTTGQRRAVTFPKEWACCVFISQAVQ